MRIITPYGILVWMSLHGDLVYIDSNLTQELPCFEEYDIDIDELVIPHETFLYTLEDYVVKDTNTVIFANADIGDINIHLTPTSVLTRVEKVDDSDNVVVILPPRGSNIAGGGSFILQSGSVLLSKDGKDWVVVGEVIENTAQAV